MNIKIGIDNLSYYFEKGYEKDYATFLYLKEKCHKKKSCFYTYTPDSFCLEIDCCRNTGVSYLKRFIKRGWVRKHKGKNDTFNLIFIHTGKFPGHIKGVLKDFTIKGSIKDIALGLYHFVLKHKQDQFNNVQKLASAITKASSYPAYKRAMNVANKRGYNVQTMPNQNSKLRISIRTIADLFKCSVGKASQIINKLRELNLITVVKRRNIVGKFTDLRIASAMVNTVKNTYFTGKVVVKVECNEYIF